MRPVDQLSSMNREIDVWSQGRSDIVDGAAHRGPVRIPGSGFEPAWK